MYATYCLRLEDDCYYVGRSSQLKERLTKHFKYGASLWTKLHKPLEVVCVVDGDHEYSMYKYAERKFGKEYVRGCHRTSPNAS